MPILAWDSPQVTSGDINPTGIQSAEAVSDSATLSLSISFTGISSQTQFGLPVVKGPTQYASPSSIQPQVNFGTATVAAIVETVFALVWSERIASPRSDSEVITHLYGTDELSRKPQASKESFLVSRRDWI